MNYIIITQPTHHLNEIEIVNYLLDLNLATLHLRKPDFTLDMMRDFLNDIPSKNHNKIVVHNHFELIKEYNLKGIHFTRHNNHQINDYNSLKISKSISTHSLEEIENLPSIFNYYFLSPIFSSTSKPGYGGDSYNLQIIKEFINTHSQKKLVALSGITHKNILEVKNCGFYGAAILGDFWNVCNENSNIKTIASYFQELNTAIH